MLTLHSRRLAVVDHRSWEAHFVESRASMDVDFDLLAVQCGDIVIRKGIRLEGREPTHRQRTMIKVHAIKKIKCAHHHFLRCALSFAPLLNLRLISLKSRVESRISIAN